MHHTVIHAKGFRSLNTGELVEFTVIQKEGKWHATSVTGANGSHVEGLSKSCCQSFLVHAHTHKHIRHIHTNIYTCTHMHTHMHTMYICTMHFDSGQSKNSRQQHIESTNAAGPKAVDFKIDTEVHHADRNTLSAPKVKPPPVPNVWSDSASRRRLVVGSHGSAPVFSPMASAMLSMVAEEKMNFGPSCFKRDPAAKIHNGLCKWYNSQRGFGFIIPDNLALNFGDVFVHHTVILSKGFRSLNAGERLEFTVRCRCRLSTIVNMSSLGRIFFFFQCECA